MSSARSGISRYTVGLPLLLFAILAVGATNFLAPQNLANVSGQITALLIVTLGQLVVALIAGIDLSVGSVVSLALAWWPPRPTRSGASPWPCCWAWRWAWSTGWAWRWRASTR